jgi:hypothetical protein
MRHYYGSLIYSNSLIREKEKTDSKLEVYSWIMDQTPGEENLVFFLDSLE